MLSSFRRGVQTLGSSIASLLGSKSFAQRVPVHVGTTEFTLGAPAGAVLVPPASLPGGGGNLAIGGPSSTADGGYEAAVSAGFAAGVENADTDYAAVDDEILNRVDLYDASTGEPVETDEGEQIFGLLQAANGSADGDAVVGGGSENLQISFVYLPRANPALTNLTLVGLGAGDYRFGLRIHRLLRNASYVSWIVGGDPLPDVLTSVYYVPTFTGVSYGGYPNGSIVVAQDTGRLRKVGPSGWVIRRPMHADEVLGGAAPYYVRTTGSDDTGDGTLGAPFATILRALKEIPLYHRGDTLSGYVVDCQEGGATFDMPGGLGQWVNYPRLKIVGLVDEATAFFTGGATAAIDAVALDTREGGRQLTFALADIPGGAAFNSDVVKRKRITITSGLMSGTQGWIYDASGQDLFVVLESGTFGDLAGGDTVRVDEYKTTLNNTGGVALLQGGVEFEDFDLDIEWYVVLHGSNAYFDHCAFRFTTGSSALAATDGGSCFLNSCYFENQHASQRNLFLGLRGSKCYVQGASVLDGNSQVLSANTYGGEMHFEGSSVFSNVSDFRVAAPRITCSEAAPENFILVHDCAGVFEQDATVEVGNVDVSLPPVFGTITGDWLLDLPAPEDAGSTTWRFREEPNLTTAIGVNNCRIGAVEGYFDHHVEIWGTGNGEKVIAQVEDWVGGPAGFVGPPVGLLGYLPSLDFQPPPANHGVVGSFVVPESHFKGKELELEAIYSTDLAAGNGGDFDYESSLLRPTDLDANPPALQEILAGQALSESAVADGIEGPIRIPLTDSDGQIGGVDPSSGGRVSVAIIRNPAGASGAVFRFYHAMRVWMKGL